MAALAAACGDGEIVVVDPGIPPDPTADCGPRVPRGLRVTLSDGEEVCLPIRGEPEEESAQEECDADFYEEIGSLTYVEKTLATESPAEEAARRVELRQHIIEKRSALEQEFLASFRGEYSDPEPVPVFCNLVLQPDDLIYKRLRFAGPRSSNVTIGCLGEGDARAQIRNPASVDLLRGKDEDPAMLEFLSTNCGVDPLVEGGSTYVDELGAVKSRCDPVSNVRITNCRIRGRTEARLRLVGREMELSMIRADYVQRLRESAPQQVVFSSVKMEGRYKGVVHLQPGVHHFTIQDSEVLGAFLGITIHLPADGGWNLIRDSTITGQRKKARTIFNLIGKKREVISIDSSEHNRIVNNHISDMKYGGIELYRNCGEKGDIRHRVPQYNQIINNVFDYSEGSHVEPIVFLGSRDDRSSFLGAGVKGYCDKDEGEDGERFAGNDVPEPWDTEIVKNSSESNDDWAQHNVIADNQSIQFRPGTPLTGRIRLSSKARELDNFLIGNELVRDRTLEEALEIQRSRRAGCAVLAGVTDGMEGPFPFVDEVRNGNLPYIRDGQTIKYFWDIRPRVRLSCGTPLVCRDNLLSKTAAVDCEEPLIRDFGAEAQPCDAADTVCAEGSNAGDEHELDCPGGNLLGVQAACNLEFGRATDTHRDTTLLNRVRVVRASDDKDDGRCTADDTSIEEGQSLVLPWLLESYRGSGARPNVVRYACREHDRNGGDCHVNVRHYCEPLGPVE